MADKVWIFRLRTWIARIIAPWMIDGCRNDSTWTVIRNGY